MARLFAWSNAVLCGRAEGGCYSICTMLTAQVVGGPPVSGAEARCLAVLSTPMKI